MQQKNQTQVLYFIIRGISDLPELQTPIFLLILLIYLVVLCGNTTIILLIYLDPRLHTPMYFFLFNLSALDILYTPITLHKVLLIYISGDNTIFFNACMSQMYLYISAVCHESLILTDMSYDRYVAICNPLRYSTVMNNQVCGILIGACWVLGFIESLPQTCIVSAFFCFKSNEINHFLCDLMALMKLSCSETNLLENYILIESMFVGIIPLSLTVTSYVYIIRTILKIPSNTGRLKTFYTCSSHLSVVIILYLSAFCLYVRPTSMSSLDSDKLLTLLFITFTPILNPIIYSLKNKDVKSAIKRVLNKRKII